MGGLKISSGLARAIPLIAAIVVFALRAVTPAGYMLASPESGEIGITVCGGAELRLLSFDPDLGAYSQPGSLGGTPADDDEPLSSENCPFALTAAFIAAPLATPEFAIAIFGDSLAPKPAAYRPSPFAAPGPPPARGPPSLT